MLKRYLRRHALLLLGATLMLALSGLVMTKVLAYTNQLAATGFTDARSVLLRGGWMYLALFAGTMTANVLLARLGAAVVTRLRTELAEKFLAIDYEKIADKKHVVFAAIIQDLGRVGPLVLFAPQLAYNAALVVLVSGYLIYVSPRLYLVFLVFLAGAVAASFFADRSTRAQFDRMRDAEEAFYEHLRAIGDGKKELSLSRARANHFADKLLRPAADKAGALMAGVHVKWALTESWATIALNVSVFAVIVIGYAVLGLSSPAIVQFVLGALFLIAPAFAVSNTVQQIGLGMASARHLEKIGLDLGAPVARPSAPAEAAISWERLEVDSVVFRHAAESGSDSRGVGPVSFTLRRGETTFLIGGNGSGKSTLLHVLCGLLPAASGEIRLDGRPVGDNWEAYRELFDGTFSDCFVFRHVLDTSGHPMQDDAVRTLLGRYELAGQIDVENGELSRLDASAGQRKRLALIQSLARDAEIYFFDEWPAEQDPAFREFFYYSVLPDLKARGKTIIVISHDDRYFHVADRLLTLQDGRVVSDGAPARAPRHEAAVAPHDHDAQLAPRAAFQEGAR